MLLQAAQQHKYAHLVEQALARRLRRSAAINQRPGRGVHGWPVRQPSAARSSRSYPGRVSTEVDASLSFDTEATVAKARKLIGMYQKHDVGRERILIKVASTWEGIRAAERLEQRRHPLQLDPPVQLRPGRRLRRGQGDPDLAVRRPDLRLVQEGQRGAEIPADQDPGVESVTKIYNYYKKFGYKTQVMGASFRKVEQITHLAGCDLLTISPDLLEKLGDQTEGEMTPRLTPEAAKSSDAREDPPRREVVSLAAQHRRHGRREAQRGHPEVLR